MGSNPISPTIVLDTSPLQALFRVDVLSQLRGIFARTLVPRAVFDETQASLSLTAAGRVPNLEDFGWIEVRALTDEDIASAGAVPIKARRSSTTYRWLDRRIDRPELEAVLLAKLTAGRALIEDRNGVKCARDSSVPVVSVADLLIELERDHHLGNAAALASKILETGYYSRGLWWLSMGLRST